MLYCSKRVILLNFINPLRIKLKYHYHNNILFIRFENTRNVSLTDAAKALNVGRVILSKLINGKSGISPEMAVRLSLALNTSSEMWLNMQMIYDLWQARKKT